MFYFYILSKDKSYWCYFLSLRKIVVSENIASQGEWKLNMKTLGGV